MVGRHTRAHRVRRRIGLSVLFVVVAALVIVALIIRNGNSPAALGGCDDSKKIAVTVAPEMESLVDSAARRVSKDDCVDYTVTAQSSAVAANTIGVSGKAPDLWLPDSSAWFGRAASATGKGAKKPDLVSASVASSPAVVVAKKIDSREAPNWLSVLNSHGLHVGDALTSAVAALPLVAAQVEAQEHKTSEGTVTASFVDLAQRNGVSGSEPASDPELLRLVSQQGGTAVVSEQMFVNATGDRGANIEATAPTTGTLMLDYPLAAVNDSSATKSAGEKLAAALTDKAGLKAMAALGFRNPSGDALADDKGVGNVPILPLKGTTLVDSALRKWSILALPTRALTVIDVSGSMLAAEPGGRRIDLTVQAALTGIGVFPDSASMGTWAFSVGLGGGKQDWKELAPVDRLGASEGDGTHRQRLQDVTKKLPSLVGGGTGLYDTALAAYRAANKDYDPQAVNSVIILSDGKNEDTDSIGLNALLKDLRAERDRSRPVVIVTIGMGAQADTGVLKQISEATGGTSYVAERPQDIPNVFVKALQSRIAD